MTLTYGEIGSTFTSGEIGSTFTSGEIGSTSVLMKSQHWCKTSTSVAKVVQFQMPSGAKTQHPVIKPPVPAEPPKDTGRVAFCP